MPFRKPTEEKLAKLPPEVRGHVEKMFSSDRLASVQAAIDLGELHDNAASSHLLSAVLYGEYYLMAEAAKALVKIGGSLSEEDRSKMLDAINRRRKDLRFGNLRQSTLNGLIEKLSPRKKERGLFD